MITLTDAERRALPMVIQGGMGAGISSWQLARTVASNGGLGIISGVAPDLLLARWLQDGDPDGHVRRALASFPHQELVEPVIARFFRPGGRAEGAPYKPIPRLDLHQKIDAVRLTVLGAYVQVWLAKEGHDGVAGINLLEKIQLWTPAALLGSVLANADYVLVGAGVPAHLPSMLDGLAACEPIRMPVDVEGALPGEAYEIELDPRVVVPGLTAPLKRPMFVAIISSHVLASYLARDELTKPDGFVVEGPVAGGHSAPPRGPMKLNDEGEPIYGARDETDLEKMLAIGLPFWLAGGFGTPEKLVEALAAGAAGVQVGSPFALSDESGLGAIYKKAMREQLRNDALKVRNDPRASPTGFPFKVVEIDDTIGMAETYMARPRQCDLGYLRAMYRRDDGTVGYRCSSEPIDAYLRKGGTIEDTEDRACLCNGLTATMGIGQHRKAGYVEAPLLTFSQDFSALKDLLAAFPEGWSARDVLAWLYAKTPVMSA